MRAVVAPMRTTIGQGDGESEQHDDCTSVDDDGASAALQSGPAEHTDVLDGSAAAEAAVGHLRTALQQHETLRLQLTRAAEELELGIASGFRTEESTASFVEKHGLPALERRLQGLEEGLAQLLGSGDGGGSSHGTGGGDGSCGSDGTGTHHHHQ